MKRAIWLCALGIFAISHAFADVRITVGDVVGDVGDMITVSYDYENDPGDDVAGFQFDLVYDPSLIVATDVSRCGINRPATHNQSCTQPDGAGQGRIRVIIFTTDVPLPAISPDSIDDFGEFDFEIVAPGSGLVEPDGVISAEDTDQQPVPMTVNTADVTATVSGVSWYVSDPTVESTLAFGPLLVGDTSGDVPLEISNLSSDTDLTISNVSFANDMESDATMTSSFAAAFDIGPGDSDTLNFACTPNQRGLNQGDITVTNNSDNEPQAGYRFACTGLAPNVSVNPTAVAVTAAAVPGGSSADADFNVFNDNTDGFSSTTAVTVVAGSPTGPGGGPPGISIGPNAFNLNPGANRQVTFTCLANENTGLGTWTVDVTVEWDDPAAGGGTDSEVVTATCEVVEEAPGYTSDPAPGSTIDFGEVPDGDESAVETIQVGNEDSIGDSEFSELEVTGASVVDSTNFQVVDFAPFTLAPEAPNGSGSVQVQCTPGSIGFVSTTLTVETNVGDQTYTLDCEGTPNFRSEPVPPGGTLNIGAGAPGTSISRALSFFNDGNGTFDVNCEFFPDGDGVISADPDPANFTLQGGGSSSIDFSCDLPGEPGSFSGTLGCYLDVPLPAPQGEVPFDFEYGITCSAQPLVIPTMNQWGLGILALMLLLMGGLVGRQFMAGRL